MIPERRYELTEEDFERFRQLINQASGIFFDRGKRDLLRLGLSDRAEETDAKSLTDYYEQLTNSPEREIELRRLLENLSVQETQFFRNLPQFDALRKFVIPELVRRKSIGYRNLRFWSAGCSTGQEPYSLAMSLLDVLPEPDTWNIQILGTDLSEAALATAEKGWYAERHLHGVDRQHLQKYFQESEGGYQVVERVRKMVHFVSHNMVNDPLPISIFGTCDVVFCRNVIIYFTHETAKYVIEHFFDILNPGGFMFLGHSETLWKMSAKYSLVEMGDAFIYKKPLPRSLEGRRFIPDRRLRDVLLPPGVASDRRRKDERRDARSEADLISQSEPSKTEKPDDDQPQIEPLLGKARASMDMGENDNAVKLLLELIKQNSDYAEAHYMLGMAYEHKNEMQLAVDSFRRTIFCDSTHSLAHFHLANTLERTGSFKGAIKEYRNAVKALKEDAPGRWEIDLDAFDAEALVNLCEWKVENLGSMES